MHGHSLVPDVDCNVKASAKPKLQPK